MLRNLITSTKESERKMNEVDIVTKDAKMLVDSAKDSFVKNIVAAATSNQVNLDQKQLQGVIAVANISFDEGYQKALPVFQRTLKNRLNTKTTAAKGK